MATSRSMRAPGQSWHRATVALSVVSATRAFSNADEREKNGFGLDRPRALALHRARAQRAVLFCPKGEAVADKPEDEGRIIR